MESGPRLRSQVQKESGFVIVQQYAGIAQLVERNLAKVEVAGPSPVSRSVSGRSSIQGHSHSMRRRSREMAFQLRLRENSSMILPCCPSAHPVAGFFV